jgi:CRISPR/Cas system CSM-associated protein Csm4 (group 5 of RAMP superfamily)
LIRWAFESGFGAKSSSGAGWVELQGIEAFSLPNKGNRAMALAPFVLENPAEVDNLKADIFVRHGMLAQEFGAYMNPFKKPILFFDEGSTFVPKHEKCFIGSMVKDLHSDRRIRQHGLRHPLAEDGARLLSRGVFDDTVQTCDTTIDSGAHWLRRVFDAS